MKYLIDPNSLTGAGGGCQRKECSIVCKLCTTLCPNKYVMLYGIVPV